MLKDIYSLNNEDSSLISERRKWLKTQENSLKYTQFS